jgi:hypothetical protein
MKSGCFSQPSGCGSESRYENRYEVFRHETRNNLIVTANQQTLPLLHSWASLEYIGIFG